MTIDDRRAELLAGGLRLPEVEELLAAESVDGVWCDGSIVIDERGRRCVTRATAERVRAARASSPLPASSAPSFVGLGVVGALVVGGLVLLVVLER